jgi:hypothetical protein
MFYLRPCFAWGEENGVNDGLGTIKNMKGKERVLFKIDKSNPQASVIAYLCSLVLKFVLCSVRWLKNLLISGVCEQKNYFISRYCYFISQYHYFISH